MGWVRTKGTVPATVVRFEASGSHALGLIEDATVEAAATVLAEQGERLGIVSAEGDFFENLGGRFGKQVPVSFWAKTYTGDRHVVDRRGGGGADGRGREEVLCAAHGNLLVCRAGRGMAGSGTRRTPRVGTSGRAVGSMTTLAAG